MRVRRKRSGALESVLLLGGCGFFARRRRRHGRVAHATLGRGRRIHGQDAHATCGEGGRGSGGAWSSRAQGALRYFPTVLIMWWRSMGLVQKSSQPQARHFSRSPVMVWAVRATMGAL